MKIGIVGTGRMGSGLGNLWAAQGHTVMFGSRDVKKAQELAASIGRNVSGGSWADAVKFGDVVLLAVPWTAAQETVLALKGPLAGKVLIDPTNAVGEQGPALPNTTSAAEQIAGWVPGAKVVKAFNTIYFEHLGNSLFDGQPEALFYCGDDANAKAMIAQLGHDAGFDPIDAGPLMTARLIEALAILWMNLAFRTPLGPDVGFRLGRR